MRFLTQRFEHKPSALSWSRFFFALSMQFLLITWIAGLFPVPANAETNSPRHLALITSFPPEFYEPFVNAFRKAHPEVQVSVLNKKTTAALGEITRGNKRGFDVFWSSSTDAFDLLKSSGNLKKRDKKRAFPAKEIPHVTLDDPEGFFSGFALSGVGWMWNRKYLEKSNLPVPKSWEDLSDPIYYDHLTMSTPSRSGTTHLIVESLLQEMGWEKGWALLLSMAGNFTTISARSYSVPEGIKSGRYGLGPVIDFLSGARLNDDIGFRYGQPTYLIPASIASLKNSANPAAGELFINFILSPAGQELLLNPEINRHPVIEGLDNPGDRVSPGIPDLIEKGKTRPYDTALSRSRYPLVIQLFDTMITYRLRDRRKLVKRVRELERLAESKGRSISSLKSDLHDQLTSVPVSWEDCRSPEFNEVFTMTSRVASASPAQRAIVQKWESFADKRLMEARRLVDLEYQKLSGISD